MYLKINGTSIKEISLLNNTTTKQIIYSIHSFIGADYTKKKDKNTIWNVEQILSYYLSSSYFSNIKCLN